MNMNGFGEDGEAKNSSTKGAKVLCSGSSTVPRGSSRLRLAFTRGARPSGRTCADLSLERNIKLTLESLSVPVDQNQHNFDQKQRLSKLCSPLVPRKSG